MTNSEKRTESRDKARNKRKPRKDGQRTGGDKPTDEAQPEAAAEASPRRSQGLPRPILWGGLAILLLGGWLGILQVNRWHFGPPVLFLWTGWLAVLLTARFLLTAGFAAAEEDDAAAEAEFWRPEGPYDELLREKRSLLKAIKEIEFDHEMGKMSDVDAKELTRFYRARAIEIIKVIGTHQDDGRELTIAEKIERELNARLSLEQVSKRAKDKARKVDSNQAKSTEAAAEAKAAKAKAKSAKTAAETEATKAKDETKSAGTAAETDDKVPAADADADAGVAAETDTDTDNDVDNDVESESSEPERAQAEVGS